jgi:hypothetical protein
LISVCLPFRLIPNFLKKESAPIIAVLIALIVEAAFSRLSF